MALCHLSNTPSSLKQFPIDKNGQFFKHLLIEMISFSTDLGFIVALKIDGGQASPDKTIFTKTQDKIWHVHAWGMKGNFLWFRPDVFF